MSSQHRRHTSLVVDRFPKNGAVKSANRNAKQSKPRKKSPVHEFLVFPTEVEHQGTCQLVRDNFPQAELCDVEQESEDILTALKIESLRPAPFIRFAFQEHGGLHIVSYCYILGLALTDTPMPRWLVREILSDDYLIEVFQLR